MSLAVGFFATLVALVIGTSLGAVSGFFGGWIDSILMRIVDVFYIFPSVTDCGTGLPSFSDGDLWEFISRSA